MKAPAKTLVTGLLPWLSSLTPSNLNEHLFREPPTLGFRLLDTFPHDTSSFTQGLHYEPETDTLLESTGMYGLSSAKRVHYENGRVVHEEPLQDDWFGEGIAVGRGGKCLQLLWREGLCLLRDATTLQLLSKHKMPRSMREGWGLTHDGQGHYYASDGTPTLHVLDDETLDVVRTITVRAGRRMLDNVNDLQWVRGELWANLWREDRICAIDPQTGNVRCFVDLEGLLSPAERKFLGYEEVLNGLAWDDERESFFVTGKNWPRLFRIQVGTHDDQYGGE